MKKNTGRLLAFGLLFSIVVICLILVMFIIIDVEHKVNFKVWFEYPILFFYATLILFLPFIMWLESGSQKKIRCYGTWKETLETSAIVCTLIIMFFLYYKMWAIVNVELVRFIWIFYVAIAYLVIYYFFLRPIYPVSSMYISKNNILYKPGKIIFISQFKRYFIKTWDKTISFLREQEVIFKDGKLMMQVGFSVSITILGEDFQNAAYFKDQNDLEDLIWINCFQDIITLKFGYMTYLEIKQTEKLFSEYQERLANYFMVKWDGKITMEEV